MKRIEEFREESQSVSAHAQTARGRDDADAHEDKTVRLVQPLHSAMRMM